LIENKPQFVIAPPEYMSEEVADFVAQHFNLCNQ